jgi:hypothetical protein
LRSQRYFSPFRFRLRRTYLILPVWPVCWERSDKAKGLLITEQWMKPAGTSILGIGRTVKNGATTGFEYMRIEQTQDGMVFISKPKENPEETVFRLIRSTPSEFVFENAAHDFPQRVIYRIEGVKLTGRIEGRSMAKKKGDRIFR